MEQSRTRCHPLTSRIVGSCQKDPIPVPITAGVMLGGGGGGQRCHPHFSSRLVSPLQGCQPSWSQSPLASRGPKATGRRASTWGHGGTRGSLRAGSRRWGQGMSPLRQPLTRHGPLQLLALAGGRFALRLRGTRCCHRAGELLPSLGPPKPTPAGGSSCQPRLAEGSVPGPNPGAALAQGEHAGWHHRVQQAHVPRWHFR